MIKEKGDKKVETWTHGRSGFETDIYLRDTSFVATLLEKFFDAPDIAMLRKQLGDYAEHWLTMEWFEILEINVSQGVYNHEKASIQFKYDRFLISESPAGQLFTVKWSVHPEHRKAEMDHLGDGYNSRGRGMTNKLKLIGFPLVAPLSRGDNEYWMAYTETLWQKCEYIANSIEDLHNQLRGMISSNEGLQKFLAIGGPQPLTLEYHKPTKKKGK